MRSMTASAASWRSTRWIRSPSTRAWKRRSAPGWPATTPACRTALCVGPEILRGNFRNELGTGLANLGDRHVRKRSMLETYVPWAEAHGATTIGNLSAVRFVAQNRRATGVMVRTSLGALKTIRVRKAVIVSGGVIASSNFLMRSGLRKNVGLRTSCNFAFPLAFDFRRGNAGLRWRADHVGSDGPAKSRRL